MTSHRSHDRTLRAEPIQPQAGPVTCGTDAEINSDVARRHDDPYEEGSTATAALFLGFFLGAGSTALMIWLVAFVL